MDTGADLEGFKAKDESLDQAAYAHAVAHTLIALLDSLPEPIIPFSLHTRCAAVNDREEALEVRLRRHTHRHTMRILNSFVQLQMQMPALVSNATVNVSVIDLGMCNYHID